MNRLDFYKEAISRNEKDLTKVRKRRNGVTLAKVLVFLCTVYLIYLLFTSGGIMILIFLLLAIAAFLGLTVLDSALLTRIWKHERFISCCQTEIRYLNNDISQLDTGHIYVDAAHPYANDLDIFGPDSLFQHVNRSVTCKGADLLAGWLLTPCLDVDKIKERQQAVAELAGQPEWGLQFRALGTIFKTSASDPKMMERWTGEPLLDRSQLWYGLICVSGAITILGWILNIAGMIPYQIPLILSVAQLLYVGAYLKKINRIYSRLDSFIRALSNYFYLVKWISDSDFESSGLKAVQSRFTSDNMQALTAFGQLKKLLSNFDQRNNVLVTFVLNSLYMRDFHLVVKLEKWRRLYGDEVGRWIDAVSETDALVGMATYRYNHPSYTFPELSDQTLLEASDLGHPLLNTGVPVTNDFEVKSLHDLYIVTGANMAGKSTFLRMVGVNIVLALSGNVVFSRKLQIRPMQLFTSMRTTDNLAKGTSYFHAELLRLQQLVGMASQSERLFIILDEMLKGTNSQDKLNGSLKFLIKLLNYPVAGLVATHDLSLGDLALTYPSHFRNVCFEITHEGKDIVYDYKLKNGVSKNMNASILLEQLGLI